jgi:hypothetical protein
MNYANYFRSQEKKGQREFAKLKFAQAVIGKYVKLIIG